MSLGDRTNLTTYKPNSKNECATEEGAVQHHTYDEADRLTDPGTTYEAFGNTTKLPANDAGESLLESGYYVDGQVSAQTQSAKTVEYKLDPAERTRATITAGKTAITHYDGPGNAIAWTAEESGKWTRQIPGIDGTLAAIQPSSGNIELQLHDLQGNVVATTGTSGTETVLLKKYNSTEFGVPNSKEAPPKYAWLGADGVASEFPTGTITQDGITYLPQTGRSLQTGGVPLPSPQNTETPFSRPIEAWVGSRAGEGAALELGKAEARQKALEIANQPPGTIPIIDQGESEGECDDTAGPCGVPDTEHGHNSDYCKVWASWGKFRYPPTNVLTVWGHFECGIAPGIFQMQIVLLVEGASGKFSDVDSAYHVFGSDNDPTTDAGYMYEEWECQPGATYKAWVWGRYEESTPKWHEWQGSRFDGKIVQCGPKTGIIPEFDPGPGE